MTTNTTATDTDVILAEPTTIKFVSGREVIVSRVKTIQMLRLLRVFTKGIGENLADLNFDPEDENFGQSIVSLALLAIPEAESETIDFIQSLVEPKGLIKNPKTEADRKKNEKIFTEFFLEVQNPELEDVVSIIEVVVTNEVPHLTALGKRLAALLQVQTKSMTAKRGAKNQ